MKRYLFIVLFLSVLISFHSTNALVGGPGMTITLLSVPSEIQDGDTITINSTTSFQSGGFPPMGEVTFLKISDQMTLGPNTDGTMTPVTVPVIKFRPYESFTLHAIHIPISNVENIVGPAVYWYLYDNLSAPALVEGQIHKNSIDKMITEENLLITIGTFQTDPVNLTTGFDIIGGINYYLKMDGNGANFVMKTSATPFSITTLSDDMVLLFEKPHITLYSGQNLGRTVIDGSGTASIQFDVALEDKYVIAQYGDLLFSSPSYDFQILNITGIPPPPPPPDQSENNETEIPPDEEIDPEEGIVEIDPPEITVINPPNSNINENNTSESTNSNDLPGVDDFEDQISEPLPDTGIDLTDYIDIIAIAGLQTVTMIKKFKKV